MIVCQQPPPPHPSGAPQPSAGRHSQMPRAIVTSPPDRQFRAGPNHRRQELACELKGMRLIEDVAGSYHRYLVPGQDVISRVRFISDRQATHRAQKEYVMPLGSIRFSLGQIPQRFDKTLGDITYRRCGYDQRPGQRQNQIIRNMPWQNFNIADSYLRQQLHGRYHSDSDHAECSRTVEMKQAFIQRGIADDLPANCTLPTCGRE